MPPTLAPPRGPEPDATRDLRAELKRTRSPFNPFASLVDALERYLTATGRREERLEERIRTLELTVADQADKLAYHAAFNDATSDRQDALEALITGQAERIDGLMPPGEFITDEQFARMQGQTLPADAVLVDAAEGRVLG